MSLLKDLLLKHGHHPVFLGTPQGRFIDVEGDVQWQRLALVRYRSRRDLLMLHGYIAVLLALIGLGLHCVLRRRAFYSKPLQGVHL